MCGVSNTTFSTQYIRKYTRPFFLLKIHCDAFVMIIRHVLYTGNLVECHSVIMKMETVLFMYMYLLVKYMGLLLEQLADISVFVNPLLLIQQSKSGSKTS